MFKATQRPATTLSSHALDLVRKTNIMGDRQGRNLIVDQLTKAGEFGLCVIVNHHSMANLTPVRVAIDGVARLLRLARSKLCAETENLGEFTLQASENGL